MKRLSRYYFCLCSVAVWMAVRSACAQLELLADEEQQCVFAGETAKISMAWHNSGGTPLEMEIHARVYQAGSATAMLESEQPGKSLRLLAGQTILDSVWVSFPAVKVETRFLIQWVQSNRVLGLTEVYVYPRDLLKPLSALAGNEPLGTFDPENILKPLLKAQEIDTVELENVQEFSGKLAIIGPFPSRSDAPMALVSRVKRLTSAGTSVVWIQPPGAKGPPLRQRPQLTPSFYAVPCGKGTTVVVQAELEADLANSPMAQLNLVELAKLAVHPSPPRLPDQSAP